MILGARLFLSRFYHDIYEGDEGVDVGAIPT